MLLHLIFATSMISFDGHVQMLPSLVTLLLTPISAVLQAEAAERARAELRGLKEQLAAAAAQQEAAAAAMQGERLAGG
jgi:hypothetical protein